jgi:hypothetical protein
LFIPSGFVAEILDFGSDLGVRGVTWKAECPETGGVFIGGGLLEAGDFTG